MKHVKVDLSDKEFERADKVRKKYGLTWRGLIIQGTSVLLKVVK